MGPEAAKTLRRAAFWALQPPKRCPAQGFRGLRAQNAVLGNVLEAVEKAQSSPGILPPTLGLGLWALGLGPGALGLGLWAWGLELWALGVGPWAVGFGLGLGNVDKDGFGLWAVGFGLWVLGSGPWALGLGLPKPCPGQRFGP